MKKILIKKLNKKYDCKEEFIKRLNKKDINFIDVLKINYYLNKGLKKGSEK